MNSDYSIEFLPSSARQIKKLPKTAQRRLAAVIDGLAENPRPKGARSLSGHPGLLRLRSGQFRIVYMIEDERLVVLIVRVARRSAAYRDLPAPRG